MEQRYNQLVDLGIKLSNFDMFFEMSDSKSVFKKNQILLDSLKTELSKCNDADLNIVFRNVNSRGEDVLKRYFVDIYPLYIKWIKGLVKDKMI